MSRDWTGRAVPAPTKLETPWFALVVTWHEHIDPKAEPPLRLIRHATEAGALAILGQAIEAMDVHGHMYDLYGYRGTELVQLHGRDFGALADRAMAAHRAKP